MLTLKNQPKKKKRKLPANIIKIRSLEKKLKKYEEKMHKAAIDKIMSKRDYVDMTISRSRELLESLDATKKEYEKNLKTLIFERNQLTHRINITEERFLQKIEKIAEETLAEKIRQKEAEASKVKSKKKRPKSPKQGEIRLEDLIDFDLDDYDEEFFASIEDEIEEDIEEYDIEEDE